MSCSTFCLYIACNDGRHSPSVRLILKGQSLFACPLHDDRLEPVTAHSRSGANLQCLERCSPSVLGSITTDDQHHLVSSVFYSERSGCPAGSIDTLARHVRAYIIASRLKLTYYDTTNIHNRTIALYCTLRIPESPLWSH